MDEITRVTIQLMNNVTMIIFSVDIKIVRRECLLRVTLKGLPLRCLVPKRVTTIPAKPITEAGGTTQVTKYLVLETMANLMTDGSTYRLTGAGAYPQRTDRIVISCPC